MHIFENIPTSEMIRVEGGSFMMGDEKDHQVTLPGFWIGKYPVTQALWKEVMKGENPSYFKGDERPVDTISWDDIKDSFLPELKRLTGKAYRLPTEAEWEFAACGGNKSKGYKFSGSNKVDEVAWYDKKSDDMTNFVGQLKSNELEIFDMSSNGVGMVLRLIWRLSFTTSI